MKKTVLSVFLACGLIAIALTYYFGEDKENFVGDSQEHLARASVRMKWFFSGTMTGWFSGVTQGTFAEHGIDLTINPGGPDNNSVKLVAAGTDMFGVAGADEVLLARAKGIPIVAIAVLFKESPICFISKESKSIQSPQDWTGKTIEVSYGSNAEVQFRALVSKYNVTGIKEVPYTFNLAPFLEDKADVSVAYKMDQVVTLQRMGIPLSIISASDYGINPYGDVIITKESTLREHPELVRAFIDAAIESHQFAVSNPAVAVSSLISMIGGQLDLENELDVWRATIPFLLPNGDMDTIGHMSHARWTETKHVLVEYAELDPNTDESKAFQNVTSSD